MMKTPLMLLGLAAAFATGVACSQIYSSMFGSDDTEVEACAGLSGQAKIDCERQHKK